MISFRGLKTKKAQKCVLNTSYYYESRAAFTILEPLVNLYFSEDPQQKSQFLTRMFHQIHMRINAVVIQWR